MLDKGGWTGVQMWGAVQIKGRSILCNSYNMGTRDLPDYRRRMGYMQF